MQCALLVKHVNYCTSFYLNFCSLDKYQKKMYNFAISFLCRNMMVLRVHGDDIVFSSSLHQVPPRIPQMNMMKVHIPFTFRLVETSKSSYAGECDCISCITWSVTLPAARSFVRAWAYLFSLNRMSRKIDWLLVGKKKEMRMWLSWLFCDYSVIGASFVWVYLFIL